METTMTKTEAKQIWEAHQAAYKSMVTSDMHLAHAFPNAPYPRRAREMDRKFWENVVTPEFERLLGGLGD